MPTIAGVREAEPWNLGNMIGGVVLVVLVVLVVVWVVRRYLDS